MEDQDNENMGFCHECEAMWPRRIHGLSCVRCGSDFVEFINAPGLPILRPPDTFPTIEPETTVRQQWRSGNGSITYTSTTYRSPTRDRSAPSDAQPPFNSPDRNSILPLFEHVNSIMQGLLNEPYSPSDPSGNQSSTQRRPPPRGLRPEDLFSDSFLGNPSRPRSATLGTFANMPPTFQSRDGTFESPSNPESQPIAPNPMAIFTQIMGLARHGGDAVYSQEELDRVISSLIDQASTNAPGPASEEAIRNLPKKEVDEEMLDHDGKAECSICMDAVKKGEEVTELPCKHWFHGSCISTWLVEHDTCPHCRRGIMDFHRRTSQEASGEPSMPNPSPSVSGSGTIDDPYVLPRSSPVQPGHTPSSPNASPNSNSRNGGLGGWLRNQLGGGSRNN